MREMLDTAAVERRIAERMCAGRVPGLAIAVVRGEEVIYAAGFGTTSLEGVEEGLKEGGVPVTPRALFAIGSTTKPLTGTMLLRLVEAGTLDLDRPVGDTLPWLRFREAGAERVITVRRLLSHTSGLPLTAVYAGRRDPDGLERYVREQLPKREFVAPPGTLYSYSNDGLSLAGYLAESATGEAFDALMRRLVFEPLRMARTTYDPLVAMTYPLALSHAPQPDGSLAVEHRMADNAAGHPAGFLYSTVHDLANFAVLHLNAGRFRDARLLAPESVALMHTPQVSLYTVHDEGYGLTFRTERYKGFRLLRHNGVFQCYSSVFYLAPDQGVGVSILFNGIAAGVGADALAKGICDELLDLPVAAPPLQPVAPVPSAWPRHTGTYLSRFSGLAEIAVQDDQLTLRRPGAASPALRLEMLASNRYFGHAPDGKVISVGFVPVNSAQCPPSTDSQAHLADLPADPMEPMRYLMLDGAPFERLVRDDAFVPDPSAWAAYVGIYHGETGTKVVRVEGETLVVRSVEDDAEARCAALSPTSFAGVLGLFEFQIDESGVVTGLLHGRTMPHRRVSDAGT
jgi:CubicO group peptidase (beta-lactamase class C family)